MFFSWVEYLGFAYKICKERMTYSELRTLFATAARRLRRPALVPAVHSVDSHHAVVLGPAGQPKVCPNRILDLSHKPESNRMSAHPKKQNPSRIATGVFFFRSLAMTYSHMGKPHTTIGDAPFHC